MSSILEKVASYFLGGLTGFIVGLMVLSFDVVPNYFNYIPIIIPIFTLLGVIAAQEIMQYRRNKFIQNNQQLRNETVGLITHEMRTGLTSTGWAIHIILDKYNKYISPEDKKMLEFVANSIHATVMHSVNLLDVSLLDLNKLNIALEWTTLGTINDTFSEVITKYTYGATKKGIKLNASIKLEEERQAEVDLLRIRIILENLLENAIQYTIGDKKEVDVEINNDRNNLNIIVSDTGIGIPKEEQKKIFSEFFRASNAKKTLSSGSGIGLYTCQKYIKAHKGTLRFKSIENEGTTFYISIPLKTVADVNDFLSRV